MESFYKPAEFLLNLQYPNLFEQADRWGLIFRCKGCGAKVAIHDRERHFNHHRGVKRRQETMRQAKIKRERVARLAKAREAK